MKKVFKSIWWFSIIGIFTVLMWVYASLPSFVNIEAAELFKYPVQFKKEPFFYIALAVVVVFNFLIYGGGLWMAKKTRPLAAALSSWFFAFGIALNFFLIVGLNTINTLNSGEKVNTGGVELLVWLSLAFLAIAALALPVLVVINLSKK